MPSEGELCTQCWAGSLQLHEGMLVCEVCGSIHQGFAEEAQEYQTGISDARFFKKSEGMKRKGAADRAAAEEPPPPPPVGEALQAYVRALQSLLHRQAHTLVASFGMDAALVPVLRDIWLAFLAHSQLLEPATLVRLQALAERSSVGGSDEDGSVVGGGSSDEDAGGGGAGRSAVLPAGVGGRGGIRCAQMTHDRLSKKVEHELGPRLRPQSTLVLVLLACLQQGEAVSPLDIARWALDGHLPYLSLPADEGAALQQYSTILGRRLFTPTGAPSPRYLMQHAALVSHQLGLACLPLSPALWLERYVAELELPRELLPVALQLHALYQPAPLQPFGEHRAHRHPWAMLMGSLLLAVKLCYGLDGRQGSMAGLPPPPDWHDWAQRQLSRLGRLSAFPLSLNEAAQLDEPGFRAYLQYLQRGLFASFSPPADLEYAHRLLLQLSIPDEGEAGSGGAGTAGAAAAAAAVTAAPLSGTQQQAGPAAGQATGTAAAQGHFTTPAAAVASAAAAEGQPQSSSSYLFYGTSGVATRQRRDGGGLKGHQALFHPDYALVLTACSPLVWLLPEALHDLLTGLERTMIGAECELSYQYNAEEQARLARVREEAALLKRHPPGKQAQALLNSAR